MEKLKLKSEKRKLLGKKVSSLRREGLLPGVLYGKGKKSEPLSVIKKEFDRVFKEAGSNTVILLEIEEDQPKNVLIQEVSKDPVLGESLHADFYEVRMDEKITTMVPLKFIGDSKAVLELGGSLLTNKNEVEVECLPGDLPHELEVDIAALEDFDSLIRISDIIVPRGVEIKDEAEETIALIEPPRSEEEIAELDEAVEEAEMPEAEKGSETEDLEEDQAKTEEKSE